MLLPSLQLPVILNPLFGAIPGGPEMMIILLIVVLLFGANKLPKLARSSGQAIGEFSRGRAEMESELASVTNDVKDAEQATESAAETERTTVTE